MKKILVLFALFVGLDAHAQLHIDFEIANKTNEVFGPLDKSKIPHGMLLDYGYDFLEVTNYDGVLRDNNYIVPSVYRDLYNSVVSMRTHLLVPKLVDPIALEQSWKSTSKSLANKVGKGTLTTSVVVNGLYYHYSKIREDALDQGLIQVIDGKQYEDVFINTQWQNPYETKEVFAMTLPVTRINNSKIALLLEESEWRTNQDALVESFAVDFGDGSGFQPLVLGKTLGHHFAQDGDFVWTFRLKLMDGTFRYCRTPVKITGKAKLETLTTRNPACLNDPWEVIIQSTQAYKGSTGSASIQIAPADVCNLINKPLIVVEGFDPHLLGNHPIYGDTHLEQFLYDIDVKYGSEGLINLITEHNAEGFDIIYVNWDNGTDWLQRNAFVLEEVIRWVNQNKTDDAAPNVVLGQSMGGVIARYALRDMENNNEDHDTSLYISHDAPHQGAHVPPGALYMVRHALNEIIQTPAGDIGVAIASGHFPVDDARKLIDRPAVKQLLVNYVNKEYEVNNEEHKIWQEALQNMGYPRQTRNIALSNGSHCAQTYGLAPGQSLFRLYGSGSTSPGTDLITFITGLGSVVGAALGDIAALFMGYLPGQTKLKIDFHIWGFPGNQEDQLYKGWIQYEKKFLWVAPLMRNITNKSFKWEGSDLLLDNYPGGAMPFIDKIKEFEEFEINFFGSYNLDLESTSSMNFIPTVSALDVGGGLTPLAAENYLAKYSIGIPQPPEFQVPFDNYTTTYNALKSNEGHITFNAQNGDWLANELNNAATLFDCIFLCEPKQIEGNDVLCKEELYFVDVVGDTQVQWSSSNPDVAFPTAPNSAATSFTTPPNTYSQEVTITAVLTSAACGNEPVVLEKTVQVGKPGLPSDLYGPELVATGAMVSYFGGPAQGADFYEWRLPYPFDRVNVIDVFGDTWQILKSVDTYQSAHVFTGNAADDGYVQLMGVNDCGLGPAKLLYVEHSGGGGGGGGIPLQEMKAVEGDAINDGILIYPNVASNEVHISIAPYTEGEAEPPSRILGVTIFPQFQQLPIKQISYHVPGVVHAEVPVFDLATGYYAMVVNTNRGPVYKILIKD
ncbi:hypothetical protein M3P19_03315 [Muricauda sp. 2012CJ35-5]|uniref:Uncharacterized protein n=1 Tax=Flagellimonas spongiicola TaxID=2942208 RepID=A0ABT0PNQ2_9FLAO|nr:hypothetical protein [Allomuricauda spongiicola]MCL6273020.1 hypothetical protein [Allomuricauda spongiicola]